MTLRERLQDDTTAAMRSGDTLRRDVLRMVQNSIYNAEKSLRGAADKIDQKLWADVEDKIHALRNTLDSENVSEIQNRASELNIALQQVGQKLYETAGSGNGAADGEDVVEGEYQTE